MAIRKITTSDFGKLYEPLKEAGRNPKLLSESGVSLCADELQKIKDVLSDIIWEGKTKVPLFWREVHHRSELLPSLAKLLWHTNSWKSQRNIFALLAVQYGSAERATQAMRPGSGWFANDDEKMPKRAVSVAHGKGWSSFEDGTRKLVFDAHKEGINGGVEEVPIEIGLDVWASKKTKSIGGASLEIKPQKFVDGVYAPKDVKIWATYNGAGLRFNRSYEWLPIPGKMEQFRGNCFRASLPLTPLRSSCLSFAIYKVARPARGKQKALYKSFYHTLFIHPIGLMPKV
jgi:hypothetical protein